jgi:8-oxo-dGTP pyrophosphatase MutT (NUDIX family)
MTPYNSKVISKTILIRPDQTILLVKRSLADERGPGEWDLPGGTVDTAEGYKAAACRETFEEVGIRLKEEDVALVFTRSGTYSRGNRCWLFFIAKVSENQSIALSHEHYDQRWTPIADAHQESLFQQQELALQYILENNLLT